MSNPAKLSEQARRLKTLADELAATAAEFEKHEQASNQKKLTRRDVERIRSLHSAHRWKNKELAEAFDVAASTITRILNGVYWR